MGVILPTCNVIMAGTRESVGFLRVYGEDSRVGKRGLAMLGAAWLGMVGKRLRYKDLVS